MSLKYLFSPIPSKHLGHSFLGRTGSPSLCYLSYYPTCLGIRALFYVHIYSNYAGSLHIRCTIVHPHLPRESELACEAIFYEYLMSHSLLNVHSLSPRLYWGVQTTSISPWLQTVHPLQLLNVIFLLAKIVSLIDETRPYQSLPHVFTLIEWSLNPLVFTLNFS